MEQCYMPERTDQVYDTFQTDYLSDFSRVSKTDLLRAIAEVSQRKPQSVRRQYYRLNVAYGSPRQILNDSSLMRRLSGDAPVDIDKVIDLIRKEQQLVDAVIETRKEICAAQNPINCLPILKQALYAVVNGDRNNAMINIVKAMEILDSV